jgi:hypothetical protein
MVTALFFEERSVGKHLKFTKKRFTWKFEIDGKEYILDLFISRLTGKKKVRLNGDIKIESNTPLVLGGGFPLQIGSHRILVLLIADSTFDLRIDNTSFQSLYMRGNMNAHTTGLHTVTDPWASISSQPTGYYQAFARRDDEREDPFRGRSYEEPYRYESLPRSLPKKSTDPWEDYSNLEKAEKENEWGERTYARSNVEVFKKEAETRSPLKERSTNREEFQSVRNVYKPTPRPTPQPVQSPPPAQPSSQLQNAPNPFDIMEDYKPAPKLPEDLFSTSEPVQSTYSPQPIQNLKPSPVSIQPNLQPPRVFTANGSASCPFNQEVVPATTSQPDSYNPFDDSNPSSDARPSEEWSKVADLDSLDKGNYYSPIIADKIAEATKPPTVCGDIPNKPMMELAKPGANPGYMTGMPMNPMATMMAFNQYMTSMLMAQHMMSQGPPK